MYYTVGQFLPFLETLQSHLAHPSVHTSSFQNLLQVYLELRHPICTMPPSDTVCTEEILTGPNNYEMWKIGISAKLCAENVFGVVSGTDVTPMPSILVTASDVRAWQEHGKKAHSIIQLSILDALLMKTHKETSSKALFDALIKLHETPNISSAFYLFHQLFSSTWDGTSAVSKHISALQTIKSCLARMKYSVDDKVLSFILLNSLPNTPEWEMFKSSIVNTVEESRLTLDSIETWIISEDSQQHPSGHSKLAMEASRTGSSKPSTRPSNANAWCEHHLSKIHNTSDCHTYKKWVSQLRNGGFREPEKGRDKVNVVEGTPGLPVLY